VQAVARERGDVQVDTADDGSESWPESWYTLRDKLIDDAVERFGAEGYRSAGFTVEGRLEEGDSESVDVRLSGGQEIAVVGICDFDCGDMDLALLNSRGRTLTADVSLDHFPVLQNAPESEGIYSVKVTMAACSNEPCYYALQYFTK
jgi:hypothetical protein